MIHTVIGIDPGKQGGIAVLDGNTVNVYPYSDDKLLEVAAQYENDDTVIALVELVHAMPKQGVTSTFSFGKAAGYIDGALAAHGVKKMFCSPQSWKFYHKLIGKDKAASIERAHELYPDVLLRRTPRCKTDSDGMAEALLISHYGYKTLATPRV